jgi:2-polyprenyl-3-methyl-5-hydroxy-6-metoxy-1,4-benzoquinol methylase
MVKVDHRRAVQELEHYTDLCGDPHAPGEGAPRVWDAILGKAHERIKEKTGRSYFEHIVAKLSQAGQPRLLSLGCGGAGIEMSLAREAPQAEFTCVDMDGRVFEAASRQAREAGLRFTFLAADLSRTELDQGRFDVVFCHASLHHFSGIERIMEQIERSLAQHGEVMAMDAITLSSYRMHPETRKVARDVFRTLPRRYRLNHTGYTKKVTDEELFEPPVADGRKRQGNTDVLPQLRRFFREKTYVPHFALCRRFFDSMYGPNYDLSRPLDRAIVDWLWALDCHYVDQEILPPESFFGIYDRP